MPDDALGIPGSDRPLPLFRCVSLFSITDCHLTCRENREWQRTEKISRSSSPLYAGHGTDPHSAHSSAPRLLGARDYGPRGVVSWESSVPCYAHRLDLAVSGWRGGCEIPDPLDSPDDDRMGRDETVLRASLRATTNVSARAKKS